MMNALVLLLSASWHLATPSSHIMSQPVPPAPASSEGSLPAFVPGPSGSLVLVEENHALPIVTVVVAAAGGAASDPERLEGLSNLAAEGARRGAGTRDRTQLDDALDDLGASLDALVDTESTRFVGRVLSKNLEPFLDLLADVVLRPQFAKGEFERTKRELVAQIAESRNDDRSLCARNFAKRLFGRHPYGQPAEGSEASVARISRTRAQRHFREQFSGSNLIFGAAGAVTPEAFASALAARFGKLPVGRSSGAGTPRTWPPQGWRLQLVDKPDRQQVQLMFGHLGLPPTHPDYVPLLIGLTAFGGQAMNATLMNEVRTQRGWAYGAYMNAIPYRDSGMIRGWVFTGVDHAVDTLKLVLRLYEELVKNPLKDETIGFFKTFLAGSYASDLDGPDARLWRRIAAERQGLPRDWVDGFSARVESTSPEDVRRALSTHVHPHDLAITLVATEAKLMPLLEAAGVARNAVDVTPYTAF